MVNPIEKCQKSKIVSEKLVVVGHFFNGVFITGVGELPHPKKEGLNHDLFSRHDKNRIG